MGMMMPPPQAGPPDAGPPMGGPEPAPMMPAPPLMKEAPPHSAKQKAKGNGKTNKVHGGGKPAHWTAAQDEAYDKAHGIKPGSKADARTDRKHGVPTSK